MEHESQTQAADPRTQPENGREGFGSHPCKVPATRSRAKGSHKGWGRKVVSSPHFPTRSLEKHKAECPRKGPRKGLPLPLSFPYQAVLTTFPGVQSRPTAQSPPRVPERRIQRSGPNSLPTPIPKALLALHYLHKKTDPPTPPPPTLPFHHSPAHRSLSLPGVCTGIKPATLSFPTVLALRMPQLLHRWIVICLLQARGFVQWVFSSWYCLRSSGSFKG